MTLFVLLPGAVPLRKAGVARSHSADEGNLQHPGDAVTISGGTSHKAGDFPNWADLREDKMINRPGFLADFRPFGAHGGPRGPWGGFRLEEWCRLRQKSALETDSMARSWVLCVFGAGRKI